MNADEASLCASKIGQMFRNVKAPHVEAMVQTFIAPSYTPDEVVRVANEMLAEPELEGMWRLDVAVSRLRTKFASNHRNLEFEKTRRECLKREEDDVTALRELNALPAEHQAELKAKAINRLCEGTAQLVEGPVTDQQRETARVMRERWEAKDWRENRAVMRTMHELFTAEPLYTQLALPAPEGHAERAS